ncbi:MAG: TolC family protein [Campylobacterales bacterium]|nr:TolC family protein [Campylobacterales bacterium]
MHKIVTGLLALCHAALASQTLSMFLEAASQSEKVSAWKLEERSLQEQKSAASRGYLPRIELFGNAALVDERGSIDVGESYSGGAKASFLIFDGFAREHTLDELEARKAARSAQTGADQKALSLEIAQYYFELLSLRGDIAAQEQSLQKLSEELERQKQFLHARIVSQEAYERLRAAKADATYRLHDLRYEEQRLMAALYTRSALEVQSLEDADLALPEALELREHDLLSSLRYQSDAALSGAQRELSAYYPTLSVEDSYTYYGYANESSVFPLDRVEHQNRLVFAANMTLFDFFASSKAQEGAMSQKLALDAHRAYEERRVASDVALSKANIERAEAMIDAAQAALDASTRTFETVERQYRANLVDYVAYLDALSLLTKAKAQRVRAKHALQMAHALYLYHAGYDIKEFVR